MYGVSNFTFSMSKELIRETLWMGLVAREGETQRIRDESIEYMLLCIDPHDAHDRLKYILYWNERLATVQYLMKNFYHEV